MTFDELTKIVEPFITYEKNWVGLQCRFSTSTRLWRVGYGTGKPKMCGVGETIEDAVRDFIVKSQNYKSQKLNHEK